MQLIKGESSFWINRDNECLKILKGRKFEWQDEYYAVSVSESILNRVRNYIKNQESHHQHQSYDDEFDEFITKFGFQKYIDA
jgi:REP element-mobilizing transposase RayT